MYAKTDNWLEFWYLEWVFFAKFTIVFAFVLEGSSRFLQKQMWAASSGDLAERPENSSIVSINYYSYLTNL